MKEEWSEAPFSEAVLVNPPARLERGTTYPFVDMAAVNRDSRSVYPSEERVFKGSGSRFQSGDTLMARITPCLENGKIARYQALEAKQEAHGSTEFIVIRGRPHVTDNDFAYYLTQWEEVRNYAIGQMTGTSGRQRVPVDSLDHLNVPLPPLPKQRAIAHILGTLDDKIEINRRMNQTLEEMARAIYNDWFVDFGPVRAKLEGREPYLLPERWEVKALGDVLELAYGKALKADSRRPGEIPVYGSNGQVGWHNAKLVDGPGIIVGRKGNPGIISWSQNGFFPIDTSFYVVQKNTEANLPFLFFALVEQDLPSLSADSAVPGLNRNLAYMSNQILPGQGLQDAFDDYATRVFRRRYELEEEARTLSAEREALLPKLVSGELRVM